MTPIAAIDAAARDRAGAAAADCEPARARAAAGGAVVMVTHTPGPWTYEVHELSEGLAGIVYGPDGMRIGTDYLSEADAALIAAAPDLLAALKDARNFVQAELDVRLHSFCVIDTKTGRPDVSTLDETDDVYCGEAMDCLSRIDAAIAKAEPAR